VSGGVEDGLDGGEITGVTNVSNGPMEGGTGFCEGVSGAEVTGITIVSEGIAPYENPIVETVTNKIMTPKLTFFFKKKSAIPVNQLILPILGPVRSAK